MNDDPNRHTVLGTLTDRAICMPYAKPQVLRRGHRRQVGTDGRWQTQSSILEDTAAAAAFTQLTYSRMHSRTRTRYGHGVCLRIKFFATTISNRNQPRSSVARKGLFATFAQDSNPWPALNP